jgi:hypothetical protein
MGRRLRRLIGDVIGAVCVFASMIVLLYLAYGLEGWW